MTYVGIDVSKDTLDVFVAGGDTSRLSNKPGEVLGLANRLKNVSLVVLEATGGYERLLLSSLLASHVSVHVANPKRVRDFAKAQGKLAKTDAINAQILSEFGQHFHETLSRASEPSCPKLAELCAYRQDLVSMKTAVIPISRVEGIDYPSIPENGFYPLPTKATGIRTLLIP